MSGLNKEQKGSLIKLLYSFEGQPNAIQTIKSFLDKTTVKGKNVFLDELSLFEGIDSKLLLNPDFITIARIGNSKAPNADAVIDMLYFMGQSKQTDPAVPIVRYLCNDNSLIISSLIPLSRKFLTINSAIVFCSP